LLVVLRKKMNSCRQQSALLSQPVLHQSISVPFRRTSAGFSLKWLSRQVRVIWRKYKLRKVMPMLAMFLLILFGYNVLRDIKDALIVTAAGSGAETIPFLKTWVVVPAAAAVMVLYTKLSDKLDRESLFYASISPFLAFFSLFAFVMYPLRSYLHPHALAETLRAVLPLGFGGPIAIFEYWTYSLFYVMAELWGSVVLTMGFWTFANEITHVDEASSLYPVLGIAGNVPALFFSGGIVKYFSKLRQTLPPGVDKWGLTLKYLMGLVVLAGLAVCGIFYWMNRNVVPASMNAHRQEESAATLSQPNATAEKKEKKKKTMTFMDGVRFLAGSSYLRNLAVLVVCYGVSINLVEIMWKAKAKEAFPNPSDYSAFMGDVSMMTGVGTLATMAISHPVLTKLGWGAGAVTTPLVMLASGAAFLSLILFPGYFGGVAVAMKTSPLLLAVWIGTVQQIFGKAAKYTLFDPTKEMVYIALDKESKSKGKAAVDVMGHLVGKSGGAFLQQICLLACGSLAASAPSVSLVFLATIVAWLMAVNSLDIAVKPLFAKRDVETTHQQPAVIPVYASSSTKGSKSTVVPFSRSATRQHSASDKNIDAVRRALDKVYQRSNRVERAMETAAGIWSSQQLSFSDRQSADADVRRDAVVALLEASYAGERLLQSDSRNGQASSDPSRQSLSRAPRRWKRVHVNSKLTSARLNRYQVFSDDEMCVRCNASGLLVRQNFDNTLDSSKIRSLSSAFHTAICPVCRGTGKDWTAVSAFYCVG